jgi:hypothetical protein
VETKGIHKQMCFLITDLGTEDIIFSYPWLSTFKPRITWKTATIATSALPIIIQTINLRIKRINEVITRALTQEEKEQIMKELLEETTIRTTATDLALTAQRDSKRVSIPAEYCRHAKIFSEEEAQQFPPSQTWDHAIDLKPDAPDAINCKVYPLNQRYRLLLRKWLDEQLAKGYIQRLLSPITSSFFFIKKKDDELCPVQDYRTLNKHTVKNNALLPNMKQAITDLADSFIFTTFDVRWGYNNIRIKDGDQYKAAFKTCFGVFEPNIMFFGLTNSPATFQTMMDQIFRPIIDKHTLLGTVIRIYMDDIIIGTSSSITAHTAAVHNVLDLLATHDLYLKISKCVFHASCVPYLGVILEKGMTRMDPVKISGIKDWPRLQKSKMSALSSDFAIFIEPLSEDLHILHDL